MDQLNVCLTGLPRSGTTLTCTLLNKLSDTVALHEPMKANTFSKYGDREALCNVIAGFFSRTRASIEKENKVISKPARLGKGGQQEKTLQKQLRHPFTLCIKHPAAFTAMLENLGKRFRCYAVIRHPLAVLASWNMVDMPVNEGHSPAAEKLDKTLAARLAPINDNIDRQLILLSWYFEQYHRFLAKNQLLPYENIVASGGKCLEVISASAGALNQTMRNRNKKKRYDPALLQTLAERLIKTDGAHWEFYPRTSVAAMLDETLVTVD